MVLLPAGLVFGKAILNSLATRGAVRAPQRTVARTSALMGGHAASASAGGALLSTSSRVRRRHDGSAKANPFSHDEVRNRLGGTSVRMTQTQAKREAEVLREALENEEWLPVYRFANVRLASLLARAKLVQTVASVLYLPYSGFCYFTGSTTAEAFAMTVFIGTLAPLLLFIFSRYLNRIIGVIAMNKSNEYIRVGYLTFWGSRRNKYLEVSDVIPVCEGPSGRSSVVMFQWYSSGNYLFLSTRHAEIVDEERAELLFGDLSVFNQEKKV